ncbi:MAG: sugar phosphate isomerase/epimerase [Chloroflexota bacterium]
MKFGVNTWIWTAPLTVEELEKLAPKIAGMGFDHLEIPVDDPETLDFKKCREIINKAGIQSISCCAAMSPERDLIDPDLKVRQTGVDYLKACMDGLVILGGTNLVGPFYSAVGRTWQQSAEDREKDIMILVDILRDLSEYADKRGVQLGLEALNRFETSFISTAAQAVELVDRVNHPACRVMLDTFHMNIEEDSIGDTVRMVGSRLMQVHSNENNRGTPGKGHFPWKEFAQALKDINFDGVLVIESFTSKVKSIAKAAAIWRPLASSQDALAADGVRFLKELMN